MFYDVVIVCAMLIWIIAGYLKEKYTFRGWMVGWKNGENWI